MVGGGGGYYPKETRWRETKSKFNLVWDLCFAILIPHLEDHT